MGIHGIHVKGVGFGTLASNKYVHGFSNKYRSSRQLVLWHDVGD